MKYLAVVFSLMAISWSAFAGTGMGAVSCNTREGDAVALYSWFHSQADSYSNLNVFVQDNDGNFKQYKADNEKALEALSVKTEDGRTFSVTPDLQKDNCTITLK